MCTDPDAPKLLKQELAGDGDSPRHGVALALGPVAVKQVGYRRVLEKIRRR